MEAHIACYSSVLTLDHLEELVGEIAEKDIWLHRTQCSALIRQEIGPHMQQEQLKGTKNEIALMHKQPANICLAFTQYSTLATICSD